MKNTKIKAFEIKSKTFAFNENGLKSSLAGIMSSVGKDSPWQSDLHARR